MAESKPAETVEEEEVPEPKRTRSDKQREHLLHIKRTLIACFMGIAVGAISFFAVGPNFSGFSDYTLLGLLLMFAGIVLQRHILTIARLGTPKLGAKGWLYQGFMTFAFWFITWTLFLTSGVM